MLQVGIGIAKDGSREVVWTAYDVESGEIVAVFKDDEEYHGFTPLEAVQKFVQDKNEEEKAFFDSLMDDDEEVYPSSDY